MAPDIAEGLDSIQTKIGISHASAEGIYHFCLFVHVYASCLPLYLCVHTHVPERLAALLKRTEPLEAVALARRRKSGGGGGDGGGGDGGGGGGGGGTERFVDGGTGDVVSGGDGLVDSGDGVVGSGAGAVNGGAGAVHGVARAVADCIENSADAPDIPSSPKV